jgi:hypothetical protein
MPFAVHKLDRFRGGSLIKDRPGGGKKQVTNEVHESTGDEHEEEECEEVQANGWNVFTKGGVKKGQCYKQADEAAN